MNIFIGYDTRQPVAYQVLAASIIKRTSIPVNLVPLILDAMPINRMGLTQFTFSRYLVPMFCDYKGYSLFLDADMLCLADISEIQEYEPTEHAVAVVKNKQRFEWPSLMYFNNERCKDLTTDYIEAGNPQSLAWAASIGELPAEWNHCVGYDDPNPNAKIVHFTQGIPCFEETKDCEFSKEWNDELKASYSTVSWQEIMGNSVHAQRMK